MAVSSKKRANGSGTIRKRPNGRWEARVTIGTDPVTGKQRQKSIYGRTQKEVREQLDRIKVELTEKSFVEPSKMLVSVWLDMWLKDFSGNLKTATRDAYEQHIRVHLKPYIGDIQLGKLDGMEIQKLYNQLKDEKGLSAKTIKNINGVLHRALEQARKLGYIKVNPTEAVILPRVEKPGLRALEEAELVAFLKAIKGNRYEAEMFITVFTGLRQGELLGLTWDCVNFQKHQLLINKQHNKDKSDKEYKFKPLKNDKVRLITAPAEVMDMLKLQKDRQNALAAAAGELWHNDDNLVFTNEFGRYVNNKMLYFAFKDVARKIGIEELRFHDLRHTYATISLSAGDDIKTVQENLGHATASFTLSTYAASTMGMKAESASRMGRFIEHLQDSETR